MHKSTKQHYAEFQVGMEDKLFPVFIFLIFLIFLSAVKGVVHHFYFVFWENLEGEEEDVGQTLVNFHRGFPILKVQ